MTVTLKNFEITNILDSLGKIANQDIKSVKLSYRIAKIARALDSHNKDISEARQKLIDEHAKKDDNGEFIRPDNPDGTKNNDSFLLKDPAKFQEELIDFMNEEVEVEVSTKITLDQLEDSGVSLLPMEVAALEPVLEVED